jgi:hypothetical protein
MPYIQAGRCICRHIWVYYILLASTQTCIPGLWMPTHPLQPLIYVRMSVHNVCTRVCSFSTACACLLYPSVYSMYIHACMCNCSPSPIYVRVCKLICIHSHVLLAWYVFACIYLCTCEVVYMHANVYMYPQAAAGRVRQYNCIDTGLCVIAHSCTKK